MRFIILLGQVRFNLHKIKTKKQEKVYIVNSANI